MTSFFQATQIATLALWGDFKFKPYYHLGFHCDALYSFICHILRALSNLMALAYRVFITPFYIINPLLWPGLINHSLNLLDDLTALIVSVATITIHPVIVGIRTLTSMIRGYEQDTDYDQGEESEADDLGYSTAIWNLPAFA